LTTENNTNIGNKSILEKENTVYKDAIEEVIEYKNLMLFKRKPSVSKSRLKNARKDCTNICQKAK
jgi:hypothetical protein